MLLLDMNFHILTFPLYQKKIRRIPYGFHGEKNENEVIEPSLFNLHLMESENDQPFRSKFINVAVVFPRKCFAFRFGLYLSEHPQGFQYGYN